MPETTAKIRAKGLDATGFTEELAEKMWAKAHGGKPGEFVTALVELQAVEPHGPTIDGKKRLDLVLTLVEPITDDKVESAVRDLMAAVHTQRRIDSGELPLDGTVRSIEDARTGALAHVERDEDGNPVGVWDGDPEKA